MLSCPVLRCTCAVPASDCRAAVSGCDVPFSVDMLSAPPLAAAAAAAALSVLSVGVASSCYHPLTTTTTSHTFMSCMLCVALPTFLSVAFNSLIMQSSACAGRDTTPQRPMKTDFLSQDSPAPLLDALRHALPRAWNGLEEEPLMLAQDVFEHVQETDLAWLRARGVAPFEACNQPVCIFGAALAQLLTAQHYRPVSDYVVGRCSRTEMGLRGDASHVEACRSSSRSCVAVDGRLRVLMTENEDNQGQSKWK